MKILGTGLRGLVGSRIVELLNTSYEFEFSDTDITDKEEIKKKIKDSNAEIILHLAAKTDVDGCEKEKELAKNSDAWKINVEGTRNIADVCFETGKKIIYISTDFVFDGKIGLEDFYTEEDVPNPVNFYAKTKYEGEKAVQSSGENWIIARLAYPYRAKFEKGDFMRAILKRLKEGQKISAITDHIFCPTFIDDVAFALDKLIKSNSKGMFHVVGSQALSPYDAANIIAKKFGLDSSLIEKTTREEFFKGRALRPFRLALKNDKIVKSGVKMSTLEQGIATIKNQL